VDCRWTVNGLLEVDSKIESDFGVEYTTLKTWLPERLRNGLDAPILKWRFDRQGTSIALGGMPVFDTRYRRSKVAV